MIPIAGSAYTYAYATLGEICRLDHRVGPHPGVRRLATWRWRWASPPTSTTCWTTSSAGICRRSSRDPPIVGGRVHRGTGSTSPALLILLILTWILVSGVRESAGTNNVMVVIKIAAILIFVLRRGARGEHRQLASVRCRMDFRAC